MTFEDFLDKSQVGYSTIETRDDLEDVIKRTWNEAINAAIQEVGSVTGDNTAELQKLVDLLTDK